MGVGAALGRGKCWGGVKALEWGDAGVRRALWWGERAGRWQLGSEEKASAPAFVFAVFLNLLFVVCIVTHRVDVLPRYLRPAVVLQGGGDDDDAFGDFEDMETGEVVTGAAAAAALGKASKGDEVAAAAQKAIKEAEREELRLKKAAQKAAFDASVSAGRKGGRSVFACRGRDWGWPEGVLIGCGWGVGGVQGVPPAIAAGGSSALGMGESRACCSW